MAKNVKFSVIFCNSDEIRGVMFSQKHKTPVRWYIGRVKKLIFAPACKAKEKLADPKPKRSASLIAGFTR